MTTTAAPFGARAVYHPTGSIRTECFQPVGIPSAAIYKGDLVKLTGDTYVLAVCAANDASIGVFDGCEYTDSTGKPVISPYWPASLSGVTNIKMYVITDINTVFEIQGAGPISETAIGDSADIVAWAAGNTNTGQSIMSLTLAASFKGAAAVGNYRIMGISKLPNNVWGDLFTIVQVTRAKDLRFTQVNSIA
jgi:hypothetical protein